MLAELRLAVRSLARHPAFAAAAVLTLALGIGANTAIFSVVNAVLLRPAPFHELERIVMVWETDRNSSTTREPASVPDFLDYRSQNTSVESLSALMAAQVNLAAPDGEPIRVAALRVSHELLPMLGIGAVAGRGFSAEEDAVGAADTAIVSESLARRTAGRPAAAVGRVLRLDERPHTIVGVVADASDFGTLQLLSAAAYSRSFADRGEATRVDVWIPLRADPKALPRETHPIFMLGRLAPGETTASAQRELAALATDLENAYPAANRGRGVNVEPLADVVLGRVRPTLYVLLGAVALVLLIACVNVAGLLVARGAARVQEVAVRRALGATPGRVTRQFVAEGLVLSAVAAAGGVALAFAGVQMLVAAAPANVPRLTSATIDLRVLSVTLAVSLAGGLLFGLVPALHARGVDLQSTLKTDGTRGSAGGPRSAFRSVLVAGELALAIVLLAGAGLLIRSFWNLLSVDPGFRAGGVLKAEYQLPRSRYPADFAAWPDFREQHAFVAAILARAETLPGVAAAAIAGNHPLDPGFTNSFLIVGRENEAREPGWPELTVRRVTPGYFSTVGVQLLKGRLPTPADGTRNAPVVLINDAAARRFFGERDPLGAQVRMYGIPRTIVGVVANERAHGLSEAPPLAIYLPLAQAPSVDGAGVLLVRTAGDPLASAAAVRDIIRERDPALAVFALEPLDQTVARSVSERRFAMLLVGLFATLALVLGAIGVYGVLSYDVTRRVREIGIRMALGAERGSVLRMIVGRAFVLAAIGVLAGGAGALALTRTLSTLLYGVTPHDPTTFAAAAAVLTVVALAAAALPAWRAARVDPAAALRR
jgi:putative ABC transport system permease protein